MSVKLRFQENKNTKTKWYYLHIYDKGKRSKEFLSIGISSMDTKKEKDEKLRIAEIHRNKRERELLYESTGVLPKHLKNKSFKSFAEHYLDNYTKKDINTVRASVNRFYEAMGEKLKVVDITPGIMTKFRDYLNASELTGETPHSYWNRFKKVLRQAMLDGYFVKMPTENVKFKTVKEKNLNKQILDIEELRILKETKCGNDAVKKAFLFACFTGMGMAEIRELRWGNIRKGRIQTERQKTGTRIDNKIPSTALELIGKAKHKDDFVFDIYISETAINKNIKNWIKRAEIDKEITFYCARHTFAVLMLGNGADLKTVADLMGHNDIKTTTRYLNYLTDLKDKSIDNLPEL